VCWRQASAESNAAGGLPRGAVSILGAGRRLAHHQLFFDRMKLRRAERPVRTHDRRGTPTHTWASHHSTAPSAANVPDAES